MRKQAVRACTSRRPRCVVGAPRRTVEPQRSNRQFVIRFRLAIEGHFIWLCVFRIGTELRARARATW